MMYRRTIPLNKNENFAEEEDDITNAIDETTTQETTSNRKTLQGKISF